VVECIINKQTNKPTSNCAVWHDTIWDKYFWKEDRMLNRISSCWMMQWNCKQMKCRLQHNIGFTVSRIENHLISLARCETGWMKFFLGNGLCKRTNWITAKISCHHIASSLVYHTQPHNITALQENMYTAATTDITPQTLGCTWCNVQHCINLCTQQKEHQSEHLLCQYAPYETKLMGHMI
jgi:hypothetical protein